MRTIHFKVNQQRIKNIDSICHVYAGTDNYLKLAFEFSEDWDGCIKCISLGSNKLPMLLKDDCCVVPKEGFDATQLSFYLVGKKKDYRIQTGEFVINLKG